MANPHTNPWVFNYRTVLSGIGSDDDSDDDGRRPTQESQLWAELDISSRKDTAIFNKNPFSIAKINAVSRTSVASTHKQTPVVPPALTPEKSGTIEHFFKKAQKKTLLHENNRKDLIPAVVDAQACRSAGLNHIPTSTSAVPTVLTPISSSMLNPEICSTEPRALNYGPDAHISTDRSQSIHIPDVHAHTPGSLSFAVGSNKHKHNTISVPRKAAKISKISPTPQSAPLASTIVTIPPAVASPRMKQESPVLGSKHRSLKPTHASIPHELVSLSPGFTSEKRQRDEIPHDTFETPEPRGLLRHFEKPSTSTQKTGPLDAPTRVSAKKIDCHNFGQNGDEMWSTLPPRKKKFRPSTNAPSKNRSSAPFRIPGLCGNPVVQKTGMSATSSARVVTFLPTPLEASEFKKNSDKRVEEPITQFSSPLSSPRAKFSFEPDEDMDILHYRSSSPPTSDPIADGNDIEIHWNSCRIRQQYLDLSQRVKEV